MAAKRVRDHTADSPLDRAKLGGDKVKPSTDFVKPVYLVAPLKHQQPAYSVFMVEAAAVADGDEPPRVRPVAGFPSPKHAMSFVATHSEQGSWIVGVGGKRGENTVIYDPSTMKTIWGPKLVCAKRKPILVSLGSKVYAISRCPKVRNKKLDLPFRAKVLDSTPDLEPWVEYLSFRKGIRWSDQVPPTWRWRWKPLRSPPFFPLLLDPMEYRYPPRIKVSSYATVDAHILLSLDDNEAGTCALDVVKKRWVKVCDESLPFDGQAVPLGGGLFAACSTINNHRTAAIFHMSIKGSSSPKATYKLTTSLLSTLDYPMATLRDPLPLFCPMGKGKFCSVWLESSVETNTASDVNDVQIILTAFKIDNMEAILTACQTQSAEVKDLQVPVPVLVRYQNQTYRLHGPSPFKKLPMPVIASLSMERELAELLEVELAERLEVKRIKKREREAPVANVITAIVIRGRV